MDVIVQQVQTTWTRWSRGGERAAVRNAVPTSFPLPRADGSLFHEVSMHERDGFIPHEKTSAEPPFKQFGLRVTKDRLQVQLPDGFGVPIREFRPTILLAPGEWVCWQQNNRYSSSTGRADWSYCLTTVTVALGWLENPNQPTYRIDEIASLR